MSGAPADQTAPTEIPEISAEDIRRRLEDASLTVVDVLPRESYAGGHIPGAVSLPLAEIEARARQVLPELAAEIAAYCAKFT